MIFPSRFPIPLALILACSCGPGVAEGPLPDSSDSDDISSPLLACPEISAAPCSADSAALPVLAAATQIDDAAQMVAFARNALLLERRTAGIEEPFVWILDYLAPQDTRQHAFAELPARPSTSMRPVGLAYNLKSPFEMDRVVVLLSNDGESALYEAQIYPGTDTPADLLPVRNGKLPTLGVLRGLTYLRENVKGQGNVYVGRLCAFGDGIFCFDGSNWMTEMEPETGPLVNDLSVLRVGNNNWIIAVGDSGLIMIDSATGFKALPSHTEANLLRVSVHEDKFTAVGEEGVLINGTAGETVACTASSETLVAINRGGEDDLKGVSASGKIFEILLENRTGAFCFTGQNVGSAIDARFGGCGASSDNYLVLTSDFLYGETDCVTPL